MSGLLHNEDCTNFFYCQDFPPGKAGEITDRYVDVLAEAGVTVLLCNTNARKTNYRSEVWETFWDGYDPDGPDDQPFLAGLPKKDMKTWRKLVGNMLEVHRQGVDYPGRIIQRCRHHGISPWITLRMNDVHCNDNLNHPFHGRIFKESQFFRKGHPGYYARALDYAHPEVRDHFKALIAETLERYDIDGLELDFMREPYLFSAGKEQEGRKILSQWLCGVRQLVEEAAARRGHPVKLGVRVPSDPQVALGLGLDAPAWAKDGLIDLVVATPRWATLHYDIPLREWHSLLGNRVTLAGGLEVRLQACRGGPFRIVTPEDATGAAVAVLSGGADVVYLFNYFQHLWVPPKYQRTLNSFSSLDKLQELPRRHAVTCREVVVPGEAYKPPLPASGRALSFDLPLGPPPPAAWTVEAMIGLAGSGAESAPPTVSVNGIACELRTTETPKNGDLQLSYSVPLNAISGENTDVIAVSAADNNPIKVLCVEVEIAP
ncbi:MAG: hypothetical protein KAI66_01365 [Lentisphaeria bacterium]|nr:hypothetical protein [Lentisphaeria bacterium]